MAAIAYTHEIKKIPFAVSSRLVFKYNVNKTTLVNNENVEIAERMLRLE